MKRLLYSIKYRKYIDNKFNNATNRYGKWVEYTFHTTSFIKFHKKYNTLLKSKNENIVYCTRIINLNTEIDENKSWKYTNEKISKEG